MEQGKILVVDDEEFIRDFLDEFLTAQGFEVTTVVDGIHALEFLTEYQVQLILTDLKMPKLDGWGLIDKVVTVLELTTPIILMSAHLTQNDIEQKDYYLRENLIRLFIKKPFSLAILFEKIKEM